MHLLPAPDLAKQTNKEKDENLELQENKPSLKSQGKQTSSNSRRRNYPRDRQTVRRTRKKTTSKSRHHSTGRKSSSSQLLSFLLLLLLLLTVRRTRKRTTSRMLTPWKRFIPTKLLRKAKMMLRSVQSQ